MAEVVLQEVKRVVTGRSKPETAIPKDIQYSVDDYIDLHRMYCQLEAQLRDLRKDIEPYMQENGLTRIEGTEGGAIEIVEQSRGILTTKYSTYDVGAVKEVLDRKTLRRVLVECVDREKLEALVKLGEADDVVLEAKIPNVVPCFMVKK